MEREVLSLNRRKFLFRQAKCFLPSPGQLLNFAKIGLSYSWSILFGHSVVWGYPFVLMLEPTDRCNLRCPLCPFAARRGNTSAGKMDPEGLRRALEQMRGQVKFLQLWNRGEPFMNEDLTGMIREAKRRRIFVQTSTNGHFLDDPQTAEAIVESGLDELIVSVDGVRQETYSKYRKGGDMEKVFHGVETLASARKRKGSDTPVITVQFLVMKHNEHEVEELKETARRLGADRVVLKTVRVSSFQEGEEFLPGRPDFSRYAVVSSAEGGGELLLKTKRESCRRLWYGTVLNCDGNISPCCFDEKEEHTMGNIFTQRFDTIWKGKKYHSFRSRLLKGRKTVTICQNCTEGLETLYISDMWVS